MFSRKGNWTQASANSLDWLIRNIEKDLNLLESKFNPTIYNDAEYHISLIQEIGLRNQYEGRLKKFAE